MDQRPVRGAEPKFLTLSHGLAEHRPALRAALRAEYGIDLREVLEQHTMHCADLADLVVWLPAGSPFWRSVGGPAAISHTERELREVGYWLRVLDYRERGSKGEQPKRYPDPKWAHERRASQGVTNTKAAAYLARQRQRD